MVPVGVVAECVAIPSCLAEIVQTFEILRCVLVVSELVVSPLRVATSVCVTEIIVCVTEISVCVTEISVCVFCVTEISVCVTEIIVCVTEISVCVTEISVCVFCVTEISVCVTEIRGSVVMTVAAPSMTNVGKPTASAATPTVAAASASAFAAPGDCRSVRDDAKRAHRNACRQNAYRSLLHGTFPTRSSKAVGVGGTRDNGTDLAPSNIWLLWRSDDIMAGEREGKKERNR
jgi:hypothetical protein